MRLNFLAAHHLVLAGGKRIVFKRYVFLIDVNEVTLLLPTKTSEEKKTRPPVQIRTMTKDLEEQLNYSS